LESDPDYFGHWAGMSVGGAFVMGAIRANASFIDAPAACRASLPEANPGIYLKSSLGITLPFNLLFGLPIYYQMSAGWLAIERLHALHWHLNLNLNLNFSMILSLPRIQLSKGPSHISNARNFSQKLDLRNVFAI
jgi:hypothetical protein